MTFAAGQTVATVSLTVNGDTNFEGDETVQVQFSGGALEEAVTATGTITNDDVDPAIGSQSFTLTTNADNRTGGAGNDTFVGTIAADRGTGTTFGPGDNLTGGEGTDTLTVSVSGTHTGAQTHNVVTLTGIENVLVNNFETSANDDTFDTSLWSGVTTLGLAGSSATGDVVFSNVAAITEARMANSAGDLTMGYVASAVSGAADAQSLTLSNVSAGTFTANSVETLNVASTTAKNTLTLNTNDDYKTINVTGDQQLTLNVNDANNTITKIDASAATGNVLLSGLGSTNIAITGGAGADSVTLANIDTNDTIDGGAGTDTLITGWVGARFSETVVSAIFDRNGSRT